MFNRFPQVFNTPEIRIDCDDKEKFSIIQKVSENLIKSRKEIINIDGVRVKNNDGWWLLRASNTQPVLVLRCEALSEKGLKFQISSVKDELGKINKLLSNKIIA